MSFYPFPNVFYSVLAVLLLSLLLLFAGCQTEGQSENKSGDSNPSTTMPVIEDSPFNVASGRLYRIHDYPSDHITPRNIDIWVPESHDTTRHAVLYMHDGQMLFDGSTTWNGQEWNVDETLTRLMGEDSVPSIMVVGIWSNPDTRHSDYFPQKPFEQMSAADKQAVMSAVRDQDSQLFRTDIASDGYLRFITKELKPFVDAHFPTRPERRTTWTMGASMGGLISMYALAEYPEVFGGFGAVSTHWPGIFEMDANPVPEAFLSYMDRELPAPGSHRLYFDFGTETLDAMYEPHQQRVDALVASKGYTDADWMTRKFEGKDHSEASWSERFHIPVLFLTKDL